MEQEWLTYAKRLQAIAETGRHFSKDPFDTERYEEISKIAVTMMARLASAPVAQVQGLLSRSSTGYATPKIDVRGALVRDGQILLVREQSDGVWSLPGGFADVGLSAAQNVRKEFLEEAGLKVQVTRLYALRYKARNAYDADLFDYYKLFFLCEAEVGWPAPQRGSRNDACRVLWPGRASAPVAQARAGGRHCGGLCPCRRSRPSTALRLTAAPERPSGTFRTR